jgi:protein-tyrosine phosphatase
MAVSIRELQRTDGLPGCFNFRDLGGHRTKKGETVRWRRLFRADAPRVVDDAECRELERLELATLIDLRTDDEIATRGCVLHPYAGDYYHLPLLATVPHETELASWSSPGFVTASYRRMLDEGADAMREIIAVLSDPASYPVLFHCSAGKDRTGVVAAVLLGALGVSGSDIVTDYARSGPAMAEMLAWMRVEYPDAGDALDATAPALLSAEPASMAGLIKAVRRDFGSFNGYVRALGVDSAIPHLRRALLRPAVA